MFAHMLLPTDGSDLSEAAIIKGLGLAKEVKAKITGVSVTPRFHTFSLDSTMIQDTQAQFEADSRAQARKCLDFLTRAAAEQGVPCETVIEVNDHPYAAIIEVAERRGCDLILMASHGHRGVQAMLVGSETQKVLTHTKIPVLVYR